MLHLLLNDCFLIKLQFVLLTQTHTHTHRHVFKYMEKLRKIDSA